METKTTKQEQVVKDLKAKYDCDLSQVLESSTTELKVVLGYSSRTHNRVIKYNYKSKDDVIIKSSAEISFNQMVSENLKKEDKS